MGDIKELVIIKILNELQQKYDINNLDVKNILDKHLSEYTFLTNKNELMVSDLNEKINFFIGIKQLEGLSVQSLRRYYEELNMFSRYVFKSVSQITVNDIRLYFSAIQSEKIYKKTTINGKLGVLRSFFGTLHKEEVINKNPAIRLKNLKVDNKNLREHLTIEELEEIRNACVTIREKALVEFLYSTGCRVSEVTNIKISDISWDKNCLVVHGKGDKYRTVYFSVKCKIYLQKYTNENKAKSDFLFIGERRPFKKLTKSGIEKIIKKIASRTALSKSIYPHIFRHTFATLALQKGMDIEVIQQLLGHEQINTTQIYATISTNQLQLSYEKYISI